MRNRRRVELPTERVDYLTKSQVERDVSDVTEEHNIQMMTGSLLNVVRKFGLP